MTTTSIVVNALNFYPAPTGLSVYAQRTLHGLAERLDLDVLAFAEANFGLQRYPHGRLPLRLGSRRANWATGKAMSQYITRYEAELADASLIYAPFTDLLWRLRHKPQVITCHDLTPLIYPNSAAAHWYVRTVQLAACRSATRVIAISRTVADLLVSQGIAARQIEVIPNGLPPATRWHNRPQGHDVVVLARHDRNKNVQLALEGFARFLAMNPHWPGRLLIIGRAGRCTHQLQQASRALNLDSRISWLALLTDQELAQTFRQAFCLISCSLMEGFDLPLLEAQAIGLPTLASDIGVHREMHHEASLLFRVDDHGKNMAQRLYDLANSRSLWVQLSSLGYNNASRYTLDRQSDQISQLLLSVQR
jgi:glycosyltransferase involved in cell wall biosynthesis